VAVVEEEAMVAIKRQELFSGTPRLARRGRTHEIACGDMAPFFVKMKRGERSLPPSLSPSSRNSRDQIKITARRRDSKCSTVRLNASLLTARSARWAAPREEKGERKRRESAPRWKQAGRI
jgi:hypothetical protein